MNYTPTRETKLAMKYGYEMGKHRLTEKVLGELLMIIKSNEVLLDTPLTYRRDLLILKERLEKGEL